MSTALNDPLRVYLDTADLATIGDAKDETAEVVELFAQFKRLSAVLIFSMWHVVDLRNAPLDAKARVIAAIHQFPRRAMARLKRNGIELWMDPPLTEWLSEQREQVDAIEQAGNYVAQLERSMPTVPSGVPEWQVNFMKRLMHEAFRCTSDDEAVEIARRLLHKERRRIPVERFAAVIEAARNARSMRSQLLQQARADAPFLDEALRRRAVHLTDDDDIENVGKTVSARVEERRKAQRERPVGNGDIPDRGHVELAPFVDVFTCDRDICAWLAEWRTQFRYERNVVPVRSRHLRDVVSLLARLAPPIGMNENDRGNDAASLHIDVGPLDCIE